MRLEEIELRDKHYDLLDDESQVVFCEGVTNSGKSLILGVKFFKKILSSPENQKQFMLSGVSTPVLEKMYIQNDASFYNIFKPLCSYTRNGEAGSRITVKTPTGVKQIYLVGYDNAKRWKDILGLKINGTLCEEINVAHDDFIAELFLRTFRNGGFLYASSNGADPDTKAYTDYLDKGRPLEKYTDEIPESTWECLDKQKASDRYRYYFFTFKDNPAMTEDELNGLLEETPVGSWTYLTKILGERGIREGAIFADYMTEEKNIISAEQLEHKRFIKYTIGIDVGSRDFTVFTLNGFTQQFKEQIVLDYMKINQAGVEEIWKAFKEWYLPHHLEMGHRVYGAFIDYAGGGSILRDSLVARLLRTYNMQITNAYKFSIKERCDTNIKLLHQGRLLFTDRTKDVYQAFTKAFYTQDREKTDCRLFKNHTHKDLVDAVEYGASPFTEQMLMR